MQFFKATGGELLENNLKVFKNSSKVQYHFEVQRFMDSGEYFNTPKRQRHQRRRLNLIQFCSTLNTILDGNASTIYFGSSPNFRCITQMIPLIKGYHTSVLLQPFVPDACQSRQMDTATTDVVTSVIRSGQK